MSSDGEISEPEYSAESQGPEYAAEVKAELEDLGSDSDSDYMPGDSPAPSQVSDSEMDSDCDTEDAKPVSNWPEGFLEGTDLEFLVAEQKVPECDMAEAITLKHVTWGPDIPEPERRALRRYTRDAADFWEHIREEFDDYLKSSVRRLAKISAKLEKLQKK